MGCFSCEEGSDCECLCTAISSFAKECNAFGIFVRWRSNHLCRTSLGGFFSARRHASAGTMATALCPSLSVCVCCHKSVFYRNGLNESGWILARELPSTYPTLCCKEIQIPSSLLWLLSSESLLQTRDLENFASAYRSSKRVIYLARERWTLRA